MSFKFGWNGSGNYHFDLQEKTYYKLLSCNLGENFARSTCVTWHHSGGNCNNICFFCKNQEEYDFIKNKINEEKNKRKQKKFKTKKSVKDFLYNQKQVEKEDANFACFEGKYGYFFDDTYNCEKVYFKLSEEDLKELAEYNCL